VKQPRLVLVTRRFWPLLGGAERVMANLALEFQRRGCPTTILTARWDPLWPAALSYGGVPVVRLDQPESRGWGTWKYMRALARWLRQHRDAYDVVYVSMLKHDAFVALGAACKPAPVVLRAEGGGVSGDCQWQRTTRGGWLIGRRCRQAAAVIAPSRAIESELLAAGYCAARVHFLANGVPLPPPTAADARLVARRVLGEAQPALFMPSAAPLVVTTGRLHANKGLDDLIEAWPAVLVQHPEARLWIVGEGPHRSALEARMSRLGLYGRVALAGAFDAVDDFLTAADLFVLPSLEEGMSLALLEAMAAGLPVVATDIPGNRQLVADGRQGVLVPPGSPPRLAAALRRLLDQPALASELGAAARQRVAQEFTLSAAVERHLELFERLLSPQTPGDPT